MNRESVICPCCNTQLPTFPDYLEHIQMAINVVAACLPVVEGHVHELCECPSCEALRRLYQPDTVIPGVED